MADADDQNGCAKIEAGAFEISRTDLDSFQAVASSSFLIFARAGSLRVRNAFDI